MTPQEPTSSRPLSTRAVAWWVTGCLLAGGAVGLGVRQLVGVSGRALPATPADRAAYTLAPAAPPPTNSPAPQPLAVEPVKNEPVARPLPLRVVDVTPPADPFQPLPEESGDGGTGPTMGAWGGASATAPVLSGHTPPAAAFSPGGGAASRGVPPVSDSLSSRGAAAPGPARPSAGVSLPADLTLMGIVSGELAVVRSGGQTLFLKIGERVADTWRVEEIKERSVVFGLGEQRVEIPIKGGSSE